MALLEQNEQKSKYILIDTPGQIEVFTWSASGQIITETLVFTCYILRSYCSYYNILYNVY